MNRLFCLLAALGLPGAFICAFLIGLPEAHPGYRVITPRAVHDGIAITVLMSNSGTEVWVVETAKGAHIVMP